MPEPIDSPGPVDDGAPSAPPVVADVAAAEATEVAGPSDPVDPIGNGEHQVRIELADFEGPLDLLLYLVKQHELDIFNIPIAFIADRYLEYIDSMKAPSLDIAGEYLLMAATLAFIKSRELLPPSEEDLLEGAEDEDGEGADPRQELIRRLLEYQKYKEAAALLNERPVTGRNVWLRGSPAHVVAGFDDQLSSVAPLAEVPVFRLIEAFERVLSRVRGKLSHDVVVDRVSIGEKINLLVDRLEKEGSFTFVSCFSFVDDPQATGLRNQIVVTFLAILEMTKLRIVRIHQPSTNGEIYISRNLEDLEAARARIAADEEITR